MSFVDRKSPDLCGGPRHTVAVGVWVALLIMLTVAGVALGSASVTAQSQSDTIEISNWTDLDNVRDDLDANYVLVNDLDQDTPGYEEVASPDANTARNGSGFDPIGNSDGFSGQIRPFRGTFDGQGHTIRDLVIGDPVRRTTAFGLFDFTSNESIIRNVRIKNVSMADNPRGVSLAGGGFVGLNRGTVANSSVSGTISGSIVGGLVGINIAPGTVTNSSVNASVTATVAAPGGADTAAAGGLVGANRRGTVSNSLVTGIVTGSEGDDFVGGIAGVLGEGVFTDSELKNGEEAILRNSYYDNQTTGQPTVGAFGRDGEGTVELRGEVTGLTTSQVQGASAAQNLEALDFTSTWQTVTDPAGYPELQALDIGDTDSDGGDGENGDTDDDGSDAGDEGGSDDGGSDDDGDGENGDAGNGGNGDGGNGGDGFGPGFGPGVVLAGLSGAGYLLKRRGTTTDTDAE